MKLTLFLILFLIALLACNLFLISNACFGTAQNSFPSNGLISSDSTWTKANSPYNLTGPVAIQEGVTLTIEPGVVVNLGEFYLQINGTIHAVGTDQNKIQFLGHTLGFFNETRHGYITFDQSSSGSIIENAVVTGDLLLFNSSANFNKDTLTEGVDITLGAPVFSNCVMQGGIGIYFSSATVTGCTITGSSGYFGIGRNQDRNYNVMAVSGDGVTIIANNHITGNNRGAITFNNEASSEVSFGGVVFGNTLYDSYNGIVIRGAGPLIVSNNEIYNCTQDGVYLAEGATATVERNLIRDNTVGVYLASPATIQHNTIRNSNTSMQASSEATVAYNNIEGYNQSIKLTSSANLNATNNWWGTTDQTAIANSIVDNRVDFNLGAVTFIPFLSAADSKALPDPNAPQPTPQPTPTQTSPPTNTPTQSSTSTSTSGPGALLGLDLFQAAAVVFLAAIFVALVVLVVVLRRGRNKNHADFSRSTNED